MTRALFLLFLTVPTLAQAADDPRVSFLEQEVRELKRQVLALSRRVDELSTRPARLAPRAPSERGRASLEPDRWIDAAKWAALRPGMAELEVVSLLGPPTSMRDENGARVLLYALEIGSTGFLGGSVTLRNRAVAEVRTPSLQ